MAPEQARGDGDADARSDVYGLGAILCEILTGEPPLSGHERTALLAAAVRGDVTVAKERLRACGADVALVDLAIRCLSMEPADRPRNAGEVAHALAEHAASVQARLRSTELQRAAAEARSVADRRARRLTMGLAAGGVAFITLLALGAVWYRQDQSQRADAKDQDVRAELQKAHALAERARELVNDPPRWESTMAAALTAARRAVQLDTLNAEAAATLARVEDDERDRQLLATLEAIRMVPSGFFESATDADRRRAAPRYRAAFAARSLDAPGAAVATAVAWLDQRSPTVRTALMGTLDEWLALYDYGDGDPTADWLRTVLRSAETDPWMRRIRDLRSRPDTARDELRRLVDEADLAAHPPAGYYLLALDLNGAGDSKKALAFLRSAQNRHPGDFWLNFFLGKMLMSRKQYADSVRFYSAARVSRPHDPRLLENLGGALLAAGQLDSAGEVFRQALDLDPHLNLVHISLGQVRRAKGDPAGALDHYRRAIDLDASHPAAHHSLANALLDLGDNGGAAVSGERSVQLDPTFAPAWRVIGNARFRLNDFAVSAAARRRVVELEPRDAEGHRLLGWSLREQKDWTAAAAAFRRATELDPADAEAFKKLAECGYVLRDWAAAAAAYRAVIALEPAHAPSHVNLGACLRQLKDLPAAVAALTRGIELNDRSFAAHGELTLTYRDLNDPARVVPAAKRAIALDPKNYAVQFALARALTQLDELEPAEAEYRRCLVMSPEDPQAHCNLGMVLRSQGRFAAALEHLRRGHSIGLQKKDWTYPSDRWVKSCEALLELEKKLSDASAAGAAEQFEMAGLVATYHRNVAEAVRHARGAFTKDPGLAAVHGIEAARWAVEAANASKDNSNRAALGKQARDWLRAGLTVPELSAKSVEVLNDMLKTTEMAWLRDEAHLFKLPEPDRSDWRTLWDNARSRLDREK